MEGLVTESRLPLDAAFATATSLIVLALLAVTLAFAAFVALPSFLFVASLAAIVTAAPPSHARAVLYPVLVHGPPAPGPDRGRTVVRP